MRGEAAFEAEAGDALAVRDSCSHERDQVIDSVADLHLTGRRWCALPKVNPAPGNGCIWMSCTLTT